MLGRVAGQSLHTFRQPLSGDLDLHQQVQQVEGTANDGNPHLRNQMGDFQRDRTPSGTEPNIGWRRARSRSMATARTISSAFNLGMRESSRATVGCGAVRRVCNAACPSPTSVTVCPSSSNAIRSVSRSVLSSSATNTCATVRPPLLHGSEYSGPTARIQALSVANSALKRWLVRAGYAAGTLQKRGYRSTM